MSPKLQRLQDRRGRPFRDLRISVTDRCNFRCRYCMPKAVFGEEFEFLPREELLTFEEIVRLVRVLRGFGLRKLRLTGGEPLLRRDLPELVGMLAAFSELDLSLTTNGTLLPRLAEPLRRAGLGRVTVSLDAVDDATFRAMNDVGAPLERVLEGVRAAESAGFRPLKINVVVVRGANDAAVVALARRFKGSGHIVRFIEYMDVGTTNGWRLDQVVSGEEIRRRIDAEMPLEPLAPAYRGEVAGRWRYRDGGGEIGLITSVTRPFCGDCTRLRLSAEGKLYTCLFAAQGHDIRAVLRGGADDAALGAAIAGIWRRRSDRYSEERSEATHGSPRVEMSYIGG